MDNNNNKNNNVSGKQASSTAEHHAPWQLEKDTEGLDKKSQAPSSESKEEDQSSQGCGCKYF